MKLTAESIKSLPTPSEGEANFWDDDVSGFGLRVRSSGARSWIFKYRIRGELATRKFTIGDAAVMPVREAREKAKDMRDAARQGKDPQTAKVEDRKAARVSFGAMVAEYLDYKADKVRPATLYATGLYLNDHCKALHATPLAKIGRADLAGAIGKIKHHRTKKAAPTSQARAYAALSDFFGWAVGVKCAIDVNPLATVRKPEAGKSRDRVLKADELAAIWNACEVDGELDDYGRIIRLLILTLQRLREIGEMEWSEISETESLLTLPGARTKNHRDHVVPLAPLALDLITQSPRRPADVQDEGARRAVFGRGPNGFSGWSKAKAALDQRIAEARGKALDHWTPHDLRRTGATMMAETLDIQPHVIEAILNHVSGHKGGVAGIYNRATYLKEKTAALALWADHVLALASGKASNVVRLRTA